MTMADDAGALRFDAVLYPHRSLDRRGFRMLMAAFATVSLVMGGLFYLSGAWPIFGFYGLDVLLIYLAFRHNFRSARAFETVRLTAGALVVEKVDQRGRRRSWTFQPYWLRVSIDDPPRHESQVTLSSRGETLVVGAFLTPEERLEFALALRQALDRLRERPA